MRARAVDVEDAVGGARLEGVEERRAWRARASCRRGTGAPRRRRRRGLPRPTPGGCRAPPGSSGSPRTDARRPPGRRRPAPPPARAAASARRAARPRSSPRANTASAKRAAPRAAPHALVLPRGEAPAPVRVEIRRVEPERLLEPFAERGGRHARRSLHGQRGEPLLHEPLDHGRVGVIDLLEGHRHAGREIRVRAVGRRVGEHDPRASARVEAPDRHLQRELAAGAERLVGRGCTRPRRTSSRRARCACGAGSAARRAPRSARGARGGAPRSAA